MRSGYSNLKCGLIGEHLGHSFSVPIHNRLADYSFVLREVERDKLGEFMQSSELDAFCVTIPYKKDVIPYLDCSSPEAKAIGAVNAVVRKDGKLYGYNTDYFGFGYMLSLANMDVRGKKALVLGRGGASLTVCTLLRDKGIGELALIGSADNTPENIARHSDAHIVINATPVGMYPNNSISPISLDGFTRCQAVLDLIYNPARTALLLEAEKKGILGISGLCMLVAQAAKAFELFTEGRYEEGCIEEIISSVGKNAENLILVGMPGCGKSTVGSLVANALGREFFDADEEFTRCHGITPADAINTLGEESFRKMEHTVLSMLGKKSSAVIATGGGAVTREENYAPLHQNGAIIYLMRDVDKLSREGRPLSLGGSLCELYQKRKPLYERFADITIDNNGSPNDTANAVASAFLDLGFGCVYKK